MTFPVTITDGILLDFNDFLDAKDINLKSKGQKELDKLEEILGDAADSDKRIEHSLSVLRNHYASDKSQLFQEEIDEIRLMLERDMSWVVGGLSARIESSFDDDPVILKAMDVLSDQVAYVSTLDPSMN
jgi:hypothetical protein